MDIAAFAAGYNQFLQAGNMGEGLRQAADTLSPTLDLFNMLGAGRRRYQNNQQANPPPLTVFLVPNGELWYVRFFGSYVTGDATGVSQGSYLGFLPAGMGVTSNFSMPLTSGLNLTAGQEGALTSQPNLIALPGDQFLIEPRNQVANTTWNNTIVYDLIKGAA